MKKFTEHSVDLVHTLLDYCGIDSEGLEEENKVLLSIDYDKTVFIVIDKGLINLIGTLGSVVPSETFYRNLLYENFQNCSGAHYRYAIEPQSGELLMSLTVQSAGIEGDDFIRVFEDFIGYAEVWGQALYRGDEKVPARDISERAPRAARPEPLTDPSGPPVPFLKA